MAVTRVQPTQRPFSCLNSPPCAFRAMSCAALAAAAATCPSQQSLASLQLYVAASGGIYVSVTQNLFFQHAKDLPPMPSRQEARAALQGGGRGLAAGGAGGRCEPWDSKVYQRVFGAEEDARLWFSWNRSVVCRMISSRLGHHLLGANSIVPAILIRCSAAWRGAH